VTGRCAICYEQEEALVHCSRCRDWVCPGCWAFDDQMCLACAIDVDPDADQQADTVTGEDFEIW
jgi:hypothetical protein